jgi:hypothetical protein
VIAVNEDKIRRWSIAGGIKSRRLHARQTLPFNCSIGNLSYFPMGNNALYAEAKSAFGVRIDTEQNAIRGHGVAQYPGRDRVPNANLDNSFFPGDMTRQRRALLLTGLSFSFGEFERPEQKMSSYSQRFSATINEWCATQRITFSG